MAISRGLSLGSLSLELKGSWYGPSDQFNSSIKGLLKALPANPNATVQPVNYIQSLENFLGEDWHNNSAPGFDSFYIKSLLIPQSAPMTQDAVQAALVYLATIGSSSDTVRSLFFLLGSKFHHGLLRCRCGPGRSECTEVQIRP